MNRQDFSMALGQADQLGNTLLQNRVMKQQQIERADDRAMRERMFGEQQLLRKENSARQLNKQKLDEERAFFETAYKSVMGNPNITDDELSQYNNKLRAFEYLGGIQLVKPQPKQPGTAKNAAAMGEEHLTKLQDDLAAAKESGDAKSIERAQRRVDNYASEKTGAIKPTTPKPTDSDRKLEAAKAAATKAELDGDDTAKQRADAIIARLENPQKPVGMGEVRQRDEELMREGAANVAPGQVADYDTELKLATEAVAAKVPFEKVAARFKARTGKDFPKP